MLCIKDILYNLLKGENCMNQEKIKELEKKINSDYSNIAGIIVQKNGARLYEN